MFEGMGLVKAALDESYGAGKVGVASAALRWLNHHSLMSPDHGGGRGQLRDGAPNNISFFSIRCNYPGGK